ncbi:MAG: twitching motility protein [Proteobacteria bacterium]|nr:twitching motility protein [Pseudomonadota bacterium]
MELKMHQAALILDIGEDGSITVNVNAENMDGLAGKICIAMAKKLLNDEGFQAELMEGVGDY